MKVSKKVFLSLGLALICFICIYLLLVFMMPDLDKVNSSMYALAMSLLIFTILLFVAKDDNGNFLRQLFITALVIGIIGFTIGFIGPIIFWPQSPQGPFLGIFITGPLSFLAGLIGGGVYWKMKYNKDSK